MVNMNFKNAKTYLVLLFYTARYQKYRFKIISTVTFGIDNSFNLQLFYFSDDEHVRVS